MGFYFLARLWQLLQELHVAIALATVVYHNNANAIYMIGNRVHHHHCTKAYRDCY
jgi:hypothetical protein